MELNRNTLCPHRLSRGRIRNASGTVDGKLKPSACVEGNVEEQRCHVHTATIQAKGIKMKLLRNIQADADLNQNKL